MELRLKTPEAIILMKPATWWYWFDEVYFKNFTTEFVEVLFNSNKDMIMVYASDLHTEVVNS